MVGLIVVALILSLTTLDYSGPAATHLPTGSILVLFGGAILNLVLARWSSSREQSPFPKTGPRT